jgi:2'-5' RNA ligase superfamily protein
MGKLQVAIALLPDAELSNRLGAAALAAHAASRGRLRWPRLPAHLSLKQPFAVDSLAAVERAVERLAGELAPIRVTLGALEVQPPSPGSPEAVVWVGVDAEPSLLELERRLDGELSLLATDVGVSPAATNVAVPLPATNVAVPPPATTDVALPFVSQAYRFHVTLGFLPTASLGDDASLSPLVGVTATFSELGVFVYDGLPRAGWQCMLFARRSLSTRP